MSRNLKLHITGLVVAGVVALVATSLVFPDATGWPLGIDPRIALPVTATQEWNVLAGVAFWCAITLAAQALPVVMPRGSVVSVSLPPIVASMILGGPVAAGWVAAIGSTELREVRGEVAWYGTLANHSMIVLPAIAGAVVMLPLGVNSDVLLVSFIAAMIGAAVYNLGNVLLASMTSAIYRGEDMRTLVDEARTYVPGLVALAPVAWLMAQVYVALGALATLLFGLPLYVQRGAYKNIVEIRDMFTQTIEALAGAVDKRDPFTGGHSRHVKDIAVAIGREMHVSGAELEALEWGGLLHDIGKIGIADAVLKKADRLTRDERIEMNAHPVKGAEIIAPVTRLAPELPVIRHHHEWYNGSGYPDRLMGDEIPKLARILHVADAFEAMTAARPYRMTPLTAEQALAELRKFAGIQFDPRVVDAFVRTHYAENVPDAGRDTPPAKPVPFLGEVAAARASDQATRLAGTLSPDVV